MADQQRKVSLIFEANASQAKNEINDLVASLQKIQSKPTSLIDPTGIREASKAALELQGHIQKAINVDTGKLDLSRFAASLSTSGKSLEQYRATLTRIGPEGTAAFRSVMNSINNAEVSTVRLTKGMRDFLVTMKNTVKWQISSSIMHGFIGGMESAYGYAKSLDASLNNIRIVTGQTSDQMARFAVEANRAAQALSTTTTKYTDAALIFYQQGLNDEMVKERTDAVIKMANVTGEAAKDVSSYMTAIWNNFNDGSKSLEYYADVITKLGAATAASSEEIAGGLEKFAAVSNTIGLSYEYATAMLTTIIDKTRQSEDVVGTALKTILARIQGLNLGETLDDGTTLNKYSDALARVGVNIKDASGQIKNMDAILDSLGSKWGTLSKDTQIALAQIVGGVRQYNQIISLMDNWGAFKQNVNLAETSAGSLNEQANIYAEGWEAARDRVRAAAEGIYDALINEDVFIKLDNIFTGLLNGISGIVKGMGGMVPILGTIGGIITQKFAKEMPVALNNMKQNLMVLSGQANKEALQTQKTNTLMAQDMVSRADNSYESSQFETIRRISSMKEKLIENQHRMNSAQIEEYQALIQNEQAIRNIIDERAKSLSLLEQEVQTMKEMLGIETAMNASNEQMESMFGEEADQEIDKVKKTDKYTALEERKKVLEGLMSDPTEDGTSDAYKRNAEELKNIENQLYVMTDKSIILFEKYSQYIQSAAGELAEFSAQQGTAARNADNLNKFLKPDNIKTYEGNLSGLKAVLETWSTTSFQSKDSVKYLEEALDALGKEGAEEAEVMNIVTEAIKKMAAAEAQAAADAKLLADAKAQELIKAEADPREVLALMKKSNKMGPSREENLENKEPKGPEIKLRGNIEVLTQAAGTLMSAYGALNAIISASNTLMDENATAMEKVGAAIGALTSITFAASSIMGLYKTLIESQIVANIKNTGTKLASAKATATEGAAYGFLTTMVKKAQAAVGGFMASHPIGWILAITAAVVALGVAIANIDWRSDEQKYLDDLKEKSEALSQAQKNLASHINEVESAWSTYQNMVNALDECTIGTEAWNEALLKCNQSVLSLLSLAPALGQFVQYNEDGSISLGGIGYEEYMAELTRKNNAIQASEILLNNKIAETELNNLYGDKGAYNAINEYIANSMGDFSEETKFDDFANLVTTIFESFGEDLESAIYFLEDMGITNADQLAPVYQAKRDFGSGRLEWNDVANSMHLFSQESLYSTMDLWSKDLFSKDMLERSSRAAYTAFFGTLKDYEVDNLSLYGNKFEEEVENALKDKSKAYSISDKEILIDLMVKTLHGKREDYAEMSADDMKYALAVADVSGNLDLMNSIVTQINDTLNGLNSVGKSLIRTGNLTQANLGREERLKPISYTGKQLQDISITNPYLGFEKNTSLDIANREREIIFSDYEWAVANETVNKLSKSIPILSDAYELIKLYKDYRTASSERIEAYFKVNDLSEELARANNNVIQLEESASTQPPVAPIDSRGGTEMYDARTKVAQIQTDLDNANRAMDAAVKREEEAKDSFFNYIASWESLSALGTEKSQEANSLILQTTAKLLGIDLVPPDQFDSIEENMLNYGEALNSHLDEIETLTKTSIESLDALSIIVDSRPNAFPITPEMVEQSSISATGMTIDELKSQGAFTPENINNFNPPWYSGISWEIQQLTSELMSQLGYSDFNFDTQTEYFGKTFDSIVDLYNYLLNPDNQESILNTIFKEFDEQVIEVLGITLDEGQNLIGYMQEHGGDYGLSLEGIENGYEQRDAILKHLQSSEFTEFQAQKAISSFLGYNFTSPQEFFEIFNANGAFDEQIEASGKTLEELNFSDILNMLFEQQVQAYRNDVLEWNKINSERFKTQLIVNPDSGDFILPEGVEESSADKLLRGLVESGASNEDIDSFRDGLSSITAGLTDEAFSDISTTLLDMIEDGADASKVLEAFNLILSETYSKGSALSNNEILKIMEKAGISTAEFSDEILNLIGIVNIAIQSLEGINSSFEKLTSTLSKAQKLKDITTGSELSEEEYKNLEEYIPDEYKELFMRSANGYTFYGTEEDRLAIEKGTREAIWAEEENNRLAAQEAGVDLGFAKTFNLESEGVGDAILSWILDSGMSSELFSTFAAANGIGPGELEEIKKAQSNNEFTKDNGIYSYEGTNETVSSALVELTNAIVAFMRGDFAGAGAEEAQLKMTGIQSLDELYNSNISIGNGEGQITQAQFDAMENFLLNKKIIEAGFDVEEIEEYGEYLQEIGKISEDLESGAVKDLTRAISRQEKAVKSVESSYEDWIDVLENSDKKSGEYYKTLSELREAYGDLFDVDPKDFDSEFIKSKENAELLRKAIEGNEEAYQELQSRAAKSVLIKAELDPNAVSTVDDEIYNLLNAINPEDIVIGTEIEDPDMTGFIQALAEAEAAAGASSDQIEKSLQKLGVDADVTINGDSGTKQLTVPTYEGTTPAQFGPFTFNIPKFGTKTLDLPFSEETPVVEVKNPTWNSNAGGHYSSRRRRGGGGGGGGGGGSRRPTAETKKEPDKERYHTITNQLEDLTDAYDKVSKAADRAFGKARIKLLQDQRKELQKLAAAQQSYIDEINNYYKQDLSNLDQVSAYVGFNLQLDENGTITNFDEIQNRMWEKYNSHINEKGEVIDMDEEAWKKYEEEWQRIMDLITKYEETQDLRKEALQQLQDYINEIYDLQLEEITYSVEIDIEASEYALEILDYLLKQVEDDAWSAAEAIAYMGEQATDFLHQSQTYNSGVADILKNHTRDITDSNGRVIKEATLTETDVQGYLNGDQASIDKIRELGLKGEFTDEEIQSLKDYHSQLLVINQSLIDLRDQVYNTLSDSFSKFNEELQDTIDIMEHLTNITDSYRNIIDLVGKKNVGISNALLESFSQIQTSQAVDLVKAQKSRLDDLTAMRDEAEALRQKMLAEGNEKDAKEIEERIKEMNKQIREATEDYTSALENALQRAEDQFKLHIDNIIEDANQAFAGAMANIQQLQDMFNLKNDTNDIYLEDFEKIYELNKLNRDITNSIDETSNIKAKEELAKLQAEINALEEDGVKVSQYQTEDLRRRYELKLAEIALNESQDAKSQVQMTRDADGNWSYIYTADENQVAEAEQNYEDKLYELQRANAEYINEMQDLLIQTETELMAKIEEITNDQTLSLEEKQALIDEFTTQYTEKFNGYAEELNLVLDNNKLLYEDEWTAYSNLTGYKISADENYVDSFNETMLSTLTGFQTAEEFHQNFNDTTEILLNESDVAFEEWENNINEVFNAAGLSSEDLAETLEEQFDNISNESENLAEDIENTGDEAVEVFNSITEAVDNWYNQYSATIDRVLTQNTALAESFRTLLSTWSDYQASSGVDDSENDTGDESPTEGEDPADEGANIQDTVAEKTEKYKKAIAFAIWSHPNSGWGHGNSSKNLTSGDRYDRLKAKGLDPNTVQQQINAYRGKSTEYMKKDSGIDFKDWGDRTKALDPYTYKKFAFDTGGYTGSWGDEGRWALLHEKEIVLNKEDTSNLLSAIGMIRQISEVIDLNAYSSAGFGSGIGAATSVGSTGTLEQVVHVTAEFPNATNKDEIYAAFGEIVNLASQYANRR